MRALVTAALSMHACFRVGSTRRVRSRPPVVMVMMSLSRSFSLSALCQRASRTCKHKRDTDKSKQTNIDDSAMATSKSRHDVVREISRHLRCHPIAHHWSDEDRKRVAGTLNQSEITCSHFDLKNHPFWTKLKTYASTWSQRISDLEDIYEWVSKHCDGPDTVVEWPDVAKIQTLVAPSVFNIGEVHPDLTKLLKSVDLMGLQRGKLGSGSWSLVGRLSHHHLRLGRPSKAVDRTDASGIWHTNRPRVFGLQVQKKEHLQKELFLHHLGHPRRVSKSRLNFHIPESL
ncbi:hypothetical protein B0T14DRAFT_295040 [Immersiella caudata]|uniref:Uncharacterized protein n=1 Tax=Immersiella caudata TaxID=314043 RepID=A0AA39WET2_9PEZI|nr:hypothetical protein B0T14DRAFT_295040 [Immersiella caudata]